MEWCGGSSCGIASVSISLKVPHDRILGRHPTRGHCLGITGRPFAGCIAQRPMDRVLQHRHPAIGRRFHPLAVPDGAQRMADIARQFPHPLERKDPAGDGSAGEGRMFRCRQFAAQPDFLVLDLPCHPADRRGVQHQLSLGIDRVIDLLCLCLQILPLPDHRVALLTPERLHIGRVRITTDRIQPLSDTLARRGDLGIALREGGRKMAGNMLLHRLAIVHRLIGTPDLVPGGLCRALRIGCLVVALAVQRIQPRPHEIPHGIPGIGRCQPIQCVADRGVVPGLSIRERGPSVIQAAQLALIGQGSRVSGHLSRRRHRAGQRAGLLGNRVGQFRRRLPRLGGIFPRGGLHHPRAGGARRAIGPGADRQPSRGVNDRLPARERRSLHRQSPGIGNGAPHAMRCSDTASPRTDAGGLPDHFRCWAPDRGFGDCLVGHMTTGHPGRAGDSIAQRPSHAGPGPEQCGARRRPREVPRHRRAACRR
ncbi:hypothetical protein GDI3606 [Gluconacetobacter diazotrophicus PA1 5]|uniref:Uncharacterized protein n=1 Tax=Gluconacetobacter diazotrophicus (strain ATCC 49037 / DSM 5601 / CCUG 37298 / CIP 103539 / LMG 7603 / PAl5) TaxID=272568 RepID=A9H6U3_GLUDA|nr:hypothetical protein GDI3606 [Gluconacetobacter diazotrophicus PA1 5]